jgi:hypothetical protein
MLNCNIPRLTTLAAAALFITSAANANLVVNGNFETGTFAGWTKSGNASLSDVISNTVTTNHTFVWRSGATGSPAFISQLLGTTAGTAYTLEFDLFNTATSNASFSAMFDGATLLSSTNTPYNWTHFVFSGLVASGSSAELKFGARNDPSFYRLDNINVFAEAAATVPEPGTWLLVLPALAIGAAATRRRRAA